MLTLAYKHLRLVSPNLRRNISVQDNKAIILQTDSPFHPHGHKLLTSLIVGLLIQARSSSWSSRYFQKPAGCLQEAGTRNGYDVAFIFLPLITRLTFEEKEVLFFFLE